ncbi:YicC family protein [Thioalkalivibrio denitrificans]|uniref:YicC family protein n=1 Tax=Thioalkalivibrio denitrificans TaxID=108003 RepID=A0A1V3NLP3_9GAMM|nr:YicC/YloC family endoribonuclease [Thioalkalivibrio denitrificans]OOG25980.1 YicC family protein [Thioalkalivibrio denitrificans]
MLRSMTGYSRCEQETDQGVLSWELRSVNHRYLEVSLRLPDAFRSMENAVRERVQARLGRGKVEVALRYHPPVGEAAGLEVNEALAKRLIEVCVQVEHWIMNSARMTALDILRWPGVVREPAPDLESLHGQALALLDTALEELADTRAREGGRLREAIETRCRSVGELVEQVRVRRPKVVEALHEKWRTRLADLGVEAEPGRLEQELAIQAQRLDVDEELDRLDGHLKEVVLILDRDEPVGRRLDFLMQEFNREANTLGSKSNDMETTRAAVELKVLIEQMREQVQNVE